MAQASKLGELTPHQRAALYWPGIQVFFIAMMMMIVMLLPGIQIYCLLLNRDGND